MEGSEKRLQAHQIEQDNFANEIKTLGEIEIKLHPAGGFDKTTGFVYEPIGEREYVFKFKGYKGVAKSSLTETLLCPQCANEITYEGKLKQLECPQCKRRITGLNPKWKLVTDFPNLKLEFTSEPLNKLIFHAPNKEVINIWLKDYLTIEDKEVTEKIVFQHLKDYFMTYFDFPFTEKESSILAIAAIQSWLTEIIDTMFYISISGETGSGKTALGEALMLVSKHGVMSSTISSAAIARVLEGLKLSLFFDEIDNRKTDKDEDITGVLRQGYRRGNHFIKLQPKTFLPETFDPFGFKSFSFRSQVVDDLQNRSIEVTLAKTKDRTLPILNMFKQQNSPFNLLFFWYLDNINEIYTKHPNFKPVVNTVNMVNMVKVNNNNNNNRSTRDVLGREVRFLLNYVNLVNQTPIFGRNVELSFLIYTICQILEINIDDLVLEIIKEKQENETANEEEGWIGVLKDVLREEYQNVFSRESVDIITYKSAISKYTRRMKEVFDIIPSQYQVKKLLRQVGFVDGVNKKVVKIEGKAKLGLIYDVDIKKNIGLNKEEVEEEKVDEVFKEIVGREND